jgi:hypothetical protein
MEPFPNIEEFDLVIVALNTLTQEIFDRILRKPAEIASEIATVCETRSVWCIIEQPLSRSPPEKGPKALPPGFTEPSNYDWLPMPATNLIHRVKPGSTVQVVKGVPGDMLRPYLEKVDRWDLEIEVVENGFEETGFRLVPIATNKSGKMISAAIAGPPSWLGAIVLLPKPTKCNTHEAIEVLIDIATGKDRLEPGWREEIEIPGISAIDAEIKNHEGKIALTQKKINELKSKRLELEEYRNVFSVHEEAQVEAVKQILWDMDIETERTQPGYPVDLQGKEVAVEVTSIADKIATSSDAPLQLLRFKEQHRKNEKMVLVANTYKREDPKNRKGRMDFTPEVLSIFVANHVCALTSATLLDIWKLSRKDKAAARNKILGTVGELRPP